jgi:hypothetical protein
MSATLEANIIEQLHRLDEQRQAEVLDFVEYLATKSIAAAQKRPQEFDPMRYSGTVQWPVDGLAYQEAVRKEWE